MNLKKRIYQFALTLTFLSMLGQNQVGAQQLPLETGGTNFVVYALEKYGIGPTQDNWPSLRFVLVHYHENPNLVKQRLQMMCDNGQKKVSLIMYFMTHGREGAGTVPSATGKPYPQLEQNLRDVFKLISELENKNNQLCFNEIQFRFRSLSSSNDPVLWEEWNESKYLENKSFIFNTRKIIKEALTDKPQTLWLDLGLELGGVLRPQNLAYTERLWRDYTNEFGTNDTYGFSIAWVEGRINALYNIYKKVDKHPSQYAVSIYGSIENRPSPREQLAQIAKELKNTNTDVLLVQETFTSHASTMQAIKESRDLGISIRAVMQWQKTFANWMRPDGSARRTFSTIGTEYIYYSLNPSGLHQSCSPTGDVAKFSWDPIPTASGFFFRLDQESNNKDGEWFFEGSTDVKDDSVQTNSYETKVLPGQKYRWWIHSKVGNQAATGAVVRQFSCDGQEEELPTPPTGNSSISSGPAQFTQPSFTTCEADSDCPSGQKCYEPTIEDRDGRMPLIGVLKHCKNINPGDFNGDGKVDTADQRLIISKFNNPYTIFDYREVMVNFGK